MNATQDPLTWVSRSPAVGEPRLRLFCFPHAGGGTAPFHRWAPLMPPGVQLCAIQLPGREARRGEPPITELARLVGELAEGLQELLDRSFAFFGHSMGALIAFELSRELRRRESAAPEALFLSSRKAPQFESPVRIHELPEVEFLQEVASFGGLPPAVAGDPELRSLFVPTLRADFQLLAAHVHRTEPPVPSRIVAMGGVRDPMVKEPHLQGWREHSAAGFALEMYPGDHFFLHEHKEAVVASVLKRLEVG